MRNIQTSWQKHDGSEQCPVSPDSVVEIETYTPYVSGTYKALAVNWNCVKFYRVIGIETMTDEMPNDVQDIEETGLELDYKLLKDNELCEQLFTEAKELAITAFSLWLETGEQSHLEELMRLSGLILTVKRK